MFDIPGSSCLDASNFHNSVTCRLEIEKSLTRGNAHFVFLPVIIESLRLSPNLWSANCFLCRHPIRNDPPAMSDNHDELESNSCKADFIHSSVIRAGVSFRLFFLITLYCQMYRVLKQTHQMRRCVCTGGTHGSLHRFHWDDRKTNK